MENIKSFDEVSQSIKRMGAKWKEQADNTASVKTYAGLHKKLTSLHLFLANEKKDINRRISAMAETYSKKVVEKNRVKLMGEFEELARTMVEAARKEVIELTRSKEEHIADMLTSAPSESQLRLLSVLGMRDDLDKVELQNIVPAFFDNYNAMKVLQNIAKSNGIHVQLPVQLDVRTMYEQIEIAHGFLMGACEQLTTLWGAMPAQYHAFYTVNDKEPGKIYDPTYAEYVELFDHVPQLQEIRTEKTALSAIEAAKIKAYFAPVADVDTSDSVEDIKVLKHVQAVMVEHPEDIELLKMSQYAKYVLEIEEAAKVNN